MPFYNERNGLIDGPIQIGLDELRILFYRIYQTMDDEGYFEAGFNGLEQINYGNAVRLKPPILYPSPDVYFLTKGGHNNLYPIDRHFTEYSEGDLFTVIEILYSCTGKYERQERGGYIFVQDEYKPIFAEHINSILKFYDEGYYLEPVQGFIMKMPNEALQELLADDVAEILDEDVMGRLKGAATSFYRFDADLEQKRQAIFTLAGILEPIRAELKETLNNVYEINKNTHDKLIFDIVNNFDIRHNKEGQYTEYQREIWYDWMMQYYTSVIITYYKLQKENE